MKRITTADETLLAAKKQKYDKKPLADRMNAIFNMKGVTYNGSSPTNNPKLILVSTGTDKYNQETMSRWCFHQHGFNVWTIADCFVQDVKVGDIVMSTAGGEDNYNALHVVLGVRRITSDVYHEMYRPIKTMINRHDQKNYRNYVMVLGNRRDISTAKNELHTKLGFKGIQCMHALKGHFNGNFSKMSVPYKWCKRNEVPEETIFSNYNKLLNFCINEVY
jgi:hypothetical protein